MVGLSKTTVLGSIPADAWCVYADGFRRAAEILIDNIDGTYEVNTVCFPIIALIRHYVELTLKEIILYGQTLDDHTTKQGGHDIKNLWTSAKSYLKRHYKDLKKDEIDIIDRLVEDIYKLDPSSEATRYPYVKSKGGIKSKAKSFSNGNVWIDFEEWKPRLREIKPIFDKITNGLSVLVDFKKEFESEI